MVANSRPASRWGKFAALGMVLALISAIAQGAPHVAGNPGALASQAQQHTAPPSPAVQVIRVEPSPQAVAQAAEEEAAERKVFGLEPDAWVAIFTLVLAIFTAGLFAATVLLHRATKRLANSTEDLAKGAEDQVAEMRRAHGLAQQQHVLAVKQFALAGRECDLAEKQHGLQRSQFMAEHRPRIRIRNAGIRREKGDFVFEFGKPVSGSVVIVNVADCDAYILEASYTFFISHTDLPMTTPLNTGPTRSLFPDFPHRLIGHGSHAAEIGWAALGAYTDAINRGTEKLYLIGAIRYHGGDIDMETGEMRDRWMGFCRVYAIPEVMGGDGRFEVIANRPDYEYED